ncbi:histone-lysine N-methyltransferase 2A-like [Cylas formicarius]|uniref:histone-lysine N-methyltransferase 2A-like n=1 Tax=Cylas formicarius TaxID=197179 RepID=UPI002958C0DA|nr:histone-lysine N-methyltransferase 2A-like [Cylas formicarius]
MADQSRNFCVKCDEKLSNDKDVQKTLKCSGSCNKGMHYTCSSYNTNELQFLENHKDNVKWYCDGCSEGSPVKVNQ